MERLSWPWTWYTFPTSFFQYLQTEAINTELTNISMPYLHFVKPVLQFCSGTCSVRTLGKLFLGLNEPLRGICKLADEPFVVLHILLTALDNFLSTVITMKLKLTGCNYTCFIQTNERHFTEENFEVLMFVTVTQATITQTSNFFASLRFQLVSSAMPVHGSALWSSNSGFNHML